MFPLAGVTLLSLVLGRIDEQDVFNSLEDHLRSPELSRKRNIFYQENLQSARDYILNYFRGLCQLESSNRCDDQEIVSHSMNHEFDNGYDWEDYIPYGVENPEEIFPMDYEGVNLILLIKGKRWGTSSDRPLVIGAHYDTFGNSSGKGV